MVVGKYSPPPLSRENMASLYDCFVFTLSCVEHESCATDINELKWHCAYQGRLETRLGRKVDQAGWFNVIVYVYVGMCYECEE